MVKIMNNDLISRSALLKYIDSTDCDACAEYPDNGSEWGFGRKTILKIISEAPAVDATSVVHGRWIPEHYGGMWPAGSPRPECKCSRCGARHYDLYAQYCPGCGAKMDDEGGENG